MSDKSEFTDSRLKISMTAAEKESIARWGRAQGKNSLAAAIRHMADLLIEDWPGDTSDHGKVFTSDYQPRHRHQNDDDA